MKDVDVVAVGNPGGRAICEEARSRGAVLLLLTERLLMRETQLGSPLRNMEWRNSHATG
jgi:hypothetical protein